MRMPARRARDAETLSMAAVLSIPSKERQAAMASQQAHREDMNAQYPSHFPEADEPCVMCYFPEVDEPCVTWHEGSLVPWTFDWRRQGQT